MNYVKNSLCSVLMLFPFFLFSAPTQRNDSVEALLNKSWRALKSFNGGRYQGQFSIKHFSQPDTFKQDGKIQFYRYRNTEYGTYFILETDSRKEWFDGQSYAWLNLKDNSWTSIEDKEAWKSYIHNSAMPLFPFFEDPMEIMQFNTPRYKLKEYSMRRVGEKNCYYIKYMMADEFDKHTKNWLKNRTFQIWIDTDNLSPVAYSEYATNEISFQMKEWRIKSLKRMNLEENEFNVADSQKMVYTLTQVQTGEHIPELITEGRTGPPFRFKTLAGDSSYLSAYKGKFVLLDFWYKGCAPCLKAMPKLQQLEEEFDSNRFVILGVNPLDKNLDELRNFLESRQLSPHLAMVNNNVAVAYGIKLFPTFIMLNEEGNVIFTKEGYAPGDENKLRKKIQKALER